MDLKLGPAVLQQIFKVMLLCGRQALGDGEESAIWQAFMECQKRAEHMVSSDRCRDGDKKEMEYVFLLSR